MLISQNLNVFVASNLQEEKEEKKSVKSLNEQDDVEYELPLILRHWKLLNYLFKTAIKIHQFIYAYLIDPFFRKTGFGYLSKVTTCIIGYALFIVPLTLYLSMVTYEYIQQKYLDPPPTLIDADIQAVPTLVSLGPMIDTQNIG